jgi:predicted RNA-binding Zn ribbon-like protein
MSRHENDFDWWANVGAEPGLDLANTRSDRLRPDVLRDRLLLQEWLEQTGAPDEIGVDQLEQLRLPVAQLLDASAAGAPLSSEAVADVNSIAAEAPAVPQLHDGALVYVAAASPARAFAAEVAAATIELVGGPSEGTLRRCQAPGCGRLFPARSHRHRWCGKRCGVRVRVATHRAAA